MKTEASRFLKWMYCLTLITVIFPSGMYGAASWAGLATGGGLLSGGGSCGSDISCHSHLPHRPGCA